MNPKSNIPPSVAGGSGDQNPKSLTVLFAGGGSGGHISPGLAIAERLIELSPRSRAIFACSNRAIDAQMLKEAGAEFVPLPATPPSLGPLAAVRFMLNFSRSKRLASRLIQERGISRVVTLGGFVAAPAVSAAKTLGIPVTLVNLDVPPGRANVWMAKRSDEVLSAIALPSMPTFAQQIVGMPIRRRALAPADPRACRASLGLDPEIYTLLITGASQGADSINQFMIALAETQPGIFNGWQILHLAGHGADELVRSAYAKAGIRAVVQPFLDHMGVAWGAADLAISRAGASSVAEAAHNDVPTLFLPYPHHKDMHQLHNVQPLVDLGAAAMAIDLMEPAENVLSIAPVLQSLLQDQARRQAMRHALQHRGHTDAAQVIAGLLLR